MISFAASTDNWILVGRSFKGIYRFLIFKYSDVNNYCITMDQYQQLFDVLTRARPRQSKAAAMQPEMITICRKEYEDLKDKYYSSNHKTE